MKAEDIVNTPVTRAEQALQGKTAGVYVLPESGSPGAGMKVRIRGTATNADANPLYIVDGVKVTDINNLDPADIEGMEVLKDAASSAIYGAEGGNGVVIITTKKGKKGEGVVTYNMQYTLQSAGDLPELMNAEQYAEYINEGGLVPGGIELTSDDADTDWLDEVTETAPMQKHYLSFSGGSENSNYLASLSYLNQDGVVGGDKANFERFTARLNLDQQVKEWLKVDTKFTYSKTDRASVVEDDTFGGLLAGALVVDPLTPVYYEDNNIPAHFQTLIDNGEPLRRGDNGKYYAISRFIAGEAVNPLLKLDISKGSTVIQKVMGNFGGEITLMEGLTFTSRVGVEYTHSKNHWWNPAYYYSSEANNYNPQVLEENNSTFQWQWDNYFSYAKTFGDNNLSAILGTSAEHKTYSFMNASASPMGKDDESFAQFDFTPQTGMLTGNEYDEKLNSYFGRVSYDYKNKYMVQASIRRDGAGESLIHPDNKWGTFPSASIGWTASEEDFWPEWAPGFAKIRASWGENGSLAALRNGWDQEGQFLYLASVTGAGIQYPLPGGGFLSGSEPSVLPNENLTWETSQQTNIGVDFRGFDNNLTFSADYFVKITKGLLALFDAPAAAGNNPPFVNAGNVENKGLELVVGYQNNFGDLNYSINANFSTLKNEVTKLTATVPRIPGASIGTGWQVATAFEEGEPLWYFRGYKTDGIDPATGDPVFVDVDGDGEITAEDQTNIGSPHPSATYGANLNLDYKGFDLNVAIQGVAGNEVVMGWIRTDRATGNKPTLFYNDRWTPTNTDASMPKANPDDRSFTSDLMVFDGSYMRIKQIQLGYTLPSDLLDKINVSRTRVFVSLDDYFTFTKYEGMDPEAGSQDNDSQGIDRGVYPIPRKVMFGLSVSF